MPVDPQAIARRYGGTARGNQVNIPTEGHGKRDRGTSITIDPAAPDGMLVHVHNGADPLAVKDMLRRDGFLPPREAASSRWPSTKTTRPAGKTFFEYADADGAIVCRKVRTDPGKKFTWQHPDGKGGWINGRGCDALFYRLPDLIAAPEDAVVYIAEGEAKADKLASWGLVATSSKDLPDDLGPLQGRCIVILPDNDAQGAKIAGDLAERLKPIAAQVVTLDLPDLPPSGDIIDWAGGKADLAALVKAATIELEGDKTGKTFQFVPVGDLEYRSPEFLVSLLIETSVLALIFGDPGCGKSFLSIELGLCVATGTPFHGHDVKQGPVFYIAGEGFNGLARRFAAWGKARGVDFKGAPLFVSTRPAQFLDAGSAKAVADAVHGLAGQHGDPALIIIDTLARNYGPGDENSTSDMSAFVAAIDDLKAQFPGCAVLIVHHSGHAEKGRARGAMALKGALDCEYRVEKDQHTIRLVNTKMKDAEPPNRLAFALDSVALDGGASSAVLELTDAPEREKRLTKAQILAQETYITAAAENGIWSDEGFAGLHLDDWRDAFHAKHTADNADAKRKAFQRVRADLQSLNLLSVENDVYLWNDDAVSTAIIMQRDSGTSGTQGDNVPTCPGAEAGESGTDGTNAFRHVPCPAPTGGCLNDDEGTAGHCPKCAGTGCEWCD